MGLRTPLCDLLGIDVPILSVGFGYGAGPELAAAVSNAGGFGVMGFSAIPPDHISQRIRRARELTPRPFGGNVIIATFDSPYATDEMRARRRDQVLAALDEHIPAIVLFWGDPAPWVAPARAAGTKVIHQVGSADEASRAAASGVDVVIVQGTEAGGHVKATESIWTVLPAAVRACGSVPVIASGGIGDGRAIARALSLGAEGVSLGTRFVASSEAWVHPHYQRRLVEASADDTVLTPDLYDVGWRDAPHRALKNSTYQQWVEAGRPASGSRPGEGESIGTRRLPWGDEPWQRYASGMLIPAFDGDAEAAPMWAGESVDAVTSVKPAGEIVRDLVRETEEALR
jgi:nitronate monooxygenase